MDYYQPKGLFITKTEKGQYVYSDPLIKGGYVISKKDYQKYRTYALRYVIGIIIIILLSTFIDIVPSLLVGLITIIVGEILFRVKFLKKTCTFMEDFKKDSKETIINNLSKNSPFWKQILKIILFIAFGILLILNAYDQQFEGIILIINWIVGVVSCGIALFLIFLLIKNRGNK